MKYRIKKKHDVCCIGDNYVVDDDIIELEEMPNQLDNLVKNGSYFPKETLEDKLGNCKFYSQKPGWIRFCPYIARVAKKHFQENPEELIDEVEGHPEIKDFVVNTLKSFRKLGGLNA